MKLLNLSQWIRLMTLVVLTIPSVVNAEPIKLLTVNVDNRNSDIAVKLIQCSAASCANQSQDQLGLVSKGKLGKLGKGWRLTTQHPSKKSVKVLRLLNPSGSMICNVLLGNHGPYMIVYPNIDTSKKGMKCKTSSSTFK